MHYTSKHAIKSASSKLLDFFSRLKKDHEDYPRNFVSLMMLIGRDRRRVLTQNIQVAMGVEPEQYKKMLN